MRKYMLEVGFQYSSSVLVAEGGHGDVSVDGAVVLVEPPSTTRSS